MLEKIDQQKEALLDACTKVSADGGLVRTLERLMRNERLSGTDYARLTLAVQFTLCSVVLKKVEIDENKTQG